MAIHFFSYALMFVIFVGACTPTNQTVNNNPPPVDSTDEPVEDREKLPPAWEKKRNAGVDFIAMGNEPSWALDLDFGGNLRFHSLGNDVDITTSIPDPVRPADAAEAVSYRAQTDGGQLNIIIFQEECRDNMSGDAFPYRVRVETKDGAFEGCGRYLQSDPLMSKWELVSINGADLNDTDYPRGRPFIDLVSEKGRMVGNAGCNSMSGVYEMKGDKLVIGPIITTKMACPNLPKEQQMLAVLSDTEVTYQLLPGRLQLRKGGEVLEFRPATGQD